MKLYKIWQTVNIDYDTYDSAVVAAETPEDAQRIHPHGDIPSSGDDSWCAYDDVNVEYIGEAKPGTNRGVIVASFNAG